MDFLDVLTSIDISTNTRKVFYFILEKSTKKGYKTYCLS